MSCDKAEFRKALGHFVTGICLITAEIENSRALAVTVNSFCSVSLEPPLVLFCLKRTADSFERLSTAPYWGVNILTDTQRHLSERGTLKGGEILAPDEYELKAFGVPVLTQTLASLICRRENEVIAGDHSIIVGRVLETSCSSLEKPLIYYHKSYKRLEETHPAVVLRSKAATIRERV